MTAGEGAGGERRPGLAERVRRWAAGLDRAGFGVFGPAQVSPPEPTPQDRRLGPCQICGKDMADHRLERTGGAARMYCPGDE